MTKPNIAVLGLGIMGTGIAANFLKNGYEVTVWNRSIEKTIDIASLGAHVEVSPTSAAKNADIIFDVTASDESSQYVFCDESEGVLNNVHSGLTIITCATLSIDWTLKLAKLCAEKDLDFFDMPMTGSRTGAETGNLVLLAGGNKDKFESIRRNLEPIASDVQYFGEAGNGMKFKLILNAIQAAHVIAFGEAMRQAKAIGIDIESAGNSLAQKPGGYPTQMAWKFLQSPPEITHFSVKWILKDLKYTKEMLESSNYRPNIDPSILDISIATLQKALDAGLGDKDWTVVNSL